MIKGALYGVRVIDFTWMIAGPSLTRLLAYMGAEVIKVESLEKICGLRPYGPWIDRVPTPPNGAGWFELYNRGKMSISFNLKTATGVELCKKLIRLSDVVVENWSAGTAKNFGLDYTTLKAINPRIIMISLTAFGQTGKYSKYIGYDRNIQAMSGINFLTGFPGGKVYGHGSPMADHLPALQGAVALLAALEYRRKTNIGQYIDVSMLEACVSALGVPVLEYLTNGRIQERIGNRHPFISPQGCYRCKGDDRWCVISVSTDQEWVCFCKVVGDNAWSEDSRFSTVTGRVNEADELDRLIEAWTQELDAEDVVGRLQKAGVAAGVVRDIKDLMLEDEHIRARGFYQDVEIKRGVRKPLDGLPFRFSLTPGHIGTKAPDLGEHTDQILTDLLGLSEREISQLRHEGVLR